MATSKPEQVPVGVRAARTAATRVRMLGAARKLFVGKGYTATTMQAIAAEADVAVADGLFHLRHPAGNPHQADGCRGRGRRRTDRHAGPALGRAGHGRAAGRTAAAPGRRCRTHARIVPVLEVVRSAAAVDPEIAELWRTNIAQRHIVLTVFAGPRC